MDYPRNVIEFEEFFPDEEAAHRYLEGLRWPEGFHCPRCAETTAAWRSGRGLLICAACRQQISVTAGTLFDKTRKPLRSWFHVAWEITNAKQGVNALTMQHRLGLRSYQTAWSWLHKFRRAMVRPDRDRLTGEVEVDEAYVGGEETGVRGRQYDEALAALQSLQHELEDRNQSAAGSLAEGLDETLTLHRLGVYGLLGRSLKTTNGLESINALIEERCAKVDHWQHSSQRQRWLATALLDIEPRLRKVMGYRHLPRLRDALKRELKIDTTTSKKRAA